tara:strand:- start:42 stop:239 length:198 start_codon:yes stop_codon:yes gene_type:complete
MSTESKKYKYIFAIKELGENIYLKQFNTDRSAEWTKSEYCRNRRIEYMNLLSEEEYKTYYKDLKQ